VVVASLTPAPDEISRLVQILEEDAWRLSVLRLVRDTLPQGWVTGGFVRNSVWDRAESQRTPVRDVDVVYLDDANRQKGLDLSLEGHFRSRAPLIPWCVRNQSRMREQGGDPRYTDMRDALAHFPDVASAVAVRLSENDVVDVIAPLGLRDLFDGLVRPTPIARTKDPRRYICRLVRKRDTWRTTWPSLVVDNLGST